MKYICTKTPTGTEEIFLFPRAIDHDQMALALQMFDNKIRKPVSAGFMDDEGTCHGYSETLNLKSRGESDTHLLNRQIPA